MEQETIEIQLTPEEDRFSFDTDIRSTKLNTP